ncbi:transketolase [Leeia oryzae]|uniref:transketolase n=1 Tax=Leeia oryzae TaxID=356662 RepID=UPI00036B2450|nr:transketolase [Leeia oryzae]
MVNRSSLANAIRALSMDAVQQANSGHPGAPMGMADIAVALWHDNLRHNPANPHWPNRDRFVLSNGHGSMLIYSLLHLSGYDVSIDDLKHFRQLHSKTPGHPEYGYTPGVETTTGPLGQGIANAVGMALAEKLLAAEFNRDGFPVVDHHTYVFVGDGCLMEGISHEVCSLAGTLNLSKLVVFYDDNGISIDGHVEGWFTDDTPKRFEAYGWHVIPKVDGHNTDAVLAAIEAAKASDKPTLICCQTVIGKGSPNKQGTHDSHGAPLGKDEIVATRAAIGWDHAPFEVPADIYAAWSAKEKGAALESAWNTLFAAYQSAYPALAAEFSRRVKGELPADFGNYVAEQLQLIDDKAETIATRKASQNAIQVLTAKLPELLGGSADLAGSNLTNWKGAQSVKVDQAGNYLHYGVREFGMAAIMNGITLYSGYRPFGGTFLMFSEYARNALRMASLMKINPIFVFTHDSIGLGEDGPTHQPVEQTATLRLIPNHDVWRPADTAESLVAWQVAVEHKKTPTSLIFSRQNLPYLKKDATQLANIRKGGYVIKAEQGKLQAVLIATGSEVELAIKAHDALAAEGIHTRVVSLPSTFMFDQQDADYRNSVLPKGTPRVAVEAGIADYWYKYVGLEGAVVGMTTFGESAPAGELFKQFGFTTENVVKTVKSVL